MCTSCMANLWYVYIACWLRTFGIMYRKVEVKEYREKNREPIRKVKGKEKKKESDMDVLADLLIVGTYLQKGA